MKTSYFMKTINYRPRKWTKTKDEPVFYMWRTVTPMQALESHWGQAAVPLIRANKSGQDNDIYQIARVGTPSAHKKSRTFQGPFSQFSRTKYHKTVADFDRTNDFITTLRSGTLGNHDNILIGNQGFTSKSLTMFDLAKSIFSNKKVALFSCPGLSRTCIRIPGLSRPGN